MLVMTGTSGHAGSHGEHHITSVATLIVTFLALVGLTALTVALAQLPLGKLDMWVTLGIATLKAALVAVYFMHLRHDKGFYGFVLVCTLGFVAIFLSVAIMDSREYQPQIQQFNEQAQPQ
jgi:cytochrome c oxidase subunit 4